MSTKNTTMITATVLLFIIIGICIALIVTTRLSLNSMPRLLSCVKRGDISGVKQCIESGDDVNQSWHASLGKYDDDLPLLEAIRLDRVEIVEMLIAAGALVGKPDSQEIYPLHQAVYRRSTVIINMLLSNSAKVDVYSPGLGTPLQVAIEKHAVKELVALLNGGANANLQDPATMLSPLAHAVVYAGGDPDVI